MSDDGARGEAPTNDVVIGTDGGIDTDGPIGTGVIAEANMLVAGPLVCSG